MTWAFQKVYIINNIIVYDWVNIMNYLFQKCFWKNISMFSQIIVVRAEWKCENAQRQIFTLRVPEMDFKR